MPIPDFPGASRLIDRLDRAVDRGCDADIAAALRDMLRESIDDPCVELPRCVFSPVEDRYARRELYRSEKFGYAAIAMTWGPGQGTPLHDHAGMWCVQGVWHGALEVTPYELVQRHGERYRFQSCGTMRVGPGSTGSLLPPHEYHTIHNPSADSLAVTLHVYRGPMTQCSVFLPLDEGWYRRDRRELSLDAMR